MMFGIFKEYIEKRINLIKINAMEQSANISGLIFFFAILFDIVNRNASRLFIRELCLWFSIDVFSMYISPRTFI